jgi:release factor glutamine methyltransferase
MARYLEDRGVASARLDAELLLAHGLGGKRIDLYTDPERPLLEEELALVRPLLAARGAGQPLAYITGEREFYSLPLLVDARVLVPRPETEVLVDAALEHARARPGRGIVIDVGTGSGAIAIAFARSLPTRHVVAVDISPPALLVARANVKRHDLSGRVHLVASDGLAALAGERLRSRVDLLLANPPYVGPDDLHLVDEGVRKNEPRDAYYAGDDPFLHYRRLAVEASQVLDGEGRLLVEVGAGRAEAVSEIFFSSGLETVATMKDLAGIPRVVVARRRV